MIIAESDNSYKGYATAIAGAIIAKGVARAIQTVTDDVRVRISPSTIIAQQGNIVIHASVKDITSNLTAYGGAGGVAAGTNVKAEAVTNANADLLVIMRQLMQGPETQRLEQKPIRKLEFMEKSSSP